MFGFGRQKDLLCKNLYQLTGKESVFELTSLPPPGLPSYPVVLAGEHKAVLGYQVAESHIAWRPDEPSADLGGSGDSFAIIRISSPSYVYWTPYSQEGLGQHPLWEVGLRWFSVFEVAESPLTKPHPILQRRHLVFQFQDTTLDLVCEGVEPYHFAGNLESMSTRVSELFRDTVRW